MAPITEASLPCAADAVAAERQGEPSCRSGLTSKDNFHAQIVPLFLGPMQTFVNGIDFKEDLKKLNAYYSAMPESVLKTGLINFAAFPPDDRDFFLTRMWDIYLPPWRDIRS